MKLEDRINIYSKKKGNTISFILNTDGSMERKSGVLCSASATDWMNGYWNNGSSWDHNRWEDRW